MTSSGSDICEFKVGAEKNFTKKYFAKTWKMFYLFLQKSDGWLFQKYVSEAATVGVL